MNAKIGQCIFILVLTALVKNQKVQKLDEYQNCKDMRKQNFHLYERNPVIEGAIESTFPANKQLFMEGLINRDFSKVKQSTYGYSRIYILHIAVISIFGIFLVILIPILTFTRCCLCCSYCQTQNKHHQQRGYTGRELKCPTFFLLGLLLVLIVLCSAILKINTDFESKYHDFKCSLNLVTHDMLSGVQYDSETNFLGLKNYNQTFNNFFRQLNTIKKQVKLGLIPKCKAIVNTKQSLAFLSSHLIYLPNGKGVGYQTLNITYANPLLGSSMNKTRVNSTLNDLLGNQNISNSLLYNFSTSVNLVNSSLFQVSNQSTPLFDNLTKIEQLQIPVFGMINPQITIIEDMQRNLESTLDIVDTNVLRSYNIGSYVLVSICIALSVGLAVVVVCLFVNKRYLYGITVYVCCGLLWVIGILFFLLGIAFVLSNPSAFYSCQYLRESLKSEQNFNKNIIGLKPNMTELKTISKCLSNSRTPDYYYNQLINSGITDEMQQIRSYLSVVYNRENQTQRLNSTYNALITSITKYRSSQILDIENPSMIDELKTITNTQDCFPDSWVPTLKPNSANITCSLTARGQADINSCDKVSDFIARAQGCTGCMDSSSIIQLFSVSEVGKTFKEALTKRYEKCVNQGKQILVDNLHTILSKYYYQKSYGLNQLEQEVKKLSANLKASVKALYNFIDPAYRNTINWINTDPVLEPAETSSLRKNMNCRVIGKGVETSVNILCNSAIPYVYFLRFLYPAAAVAILLICGLSVFLVYRHETQRKFQKIKQLEKQIKNNDVDHGVQVISNQKDNNKNNQYGEGSGKTKEKQQKQQQQNNEDIVISQNDNDDNVQETPPQSVERLSRKKYNFSKR